MANDDFQSKFVGEWKAFDKGENGPALFTALGYPTEMQEPLLKHMATMKISTDGDVVNMVVDYMPGQEWKGKFKFDEPFEVKEPSFNIHNKLTFTYKNGMMMEKVETLNQVGKDNNATFTIEGDKLVVVSECSGVKGTRKYKRV